MHRVQVQRAREEVELAQRQFLLVRPENRLVADSLERRWNEKLAELSKAEEEYVRAVKAENPDLSPAARERIQSLISDLPTVWNDQCTPARERKRILRLLIEDVTLIRDQVVHSTSAGRAVRPRHWNFHFRLAPPIYIGPRRWWSN